MKGHCAVGDATALIFLFFEIDKDIFASPIAHVAGAGAIPLRIGPDIRGVKS